MNQVQMRRYYRKTLVINPFHIVTFNCWLVPAGYCLPHLHPHPAFLYSWPDGVDGQEDGTPKLL